MLKTLGYFIKNVGEKAYKTLTQDNPEEPEILGGVMAPRLDDIYRPRRTTIEVKCTVYDNGEIVNMENVGDTDKNDTEPPIIIIE